MEPPKVLSAKSFVTSRLSAIVPVAPEKMQSFGGLEEEDRRVIQTVAKKVKTIHESTMFSTKTLPSRVILKFVGIPKVKVEDLRLVNICNNRIRDIRLSVNQGSVQVELRRKMTTKPTIKKRPQQAGLDKAMLRKTVGVFLASHASVVRDSDKRVIEAVLECILRWTWQKAAAEVDCRRIGDNYHFKVERLQSVSLNQLESLCDLGDYVRDLEMNLETKVLSFLVLRSNAYIQDGQAKRRKTSSVVAF